MATVAPTATAPTVDVTGLATAIASQLMTALQAHTLSDVALLARAMELVETVRSLSGSQKKAVLLASMEVLARMATANPSLDPDIVATIRNVAATASPFVDLVVSLSKDTAAAASSAELDASLTAVYAARDQIAALVAAARANEDALTAASITALLPSIVSALSSIKMFVEAAAAEQVAFANRVLADIRRTAPEAEKPVWQAATAGVGPVVYAIQAARSGTLSINTIRDAIVNNPEAVVSTCVTCFMAISSALAARR